MSGSFLNRSSNKFQLLKALQISTAFALGCVAGPEYGPALVLLISAIRKASFQTKGWYDGAREIPALITDGKVAYPMVIAAGLSAFAGGEVVKRLAPPPMVILDKTEITKACANTLGRPLIVRDLDGNPMTLVCR